MRLDSCRQCVRRRIQCDAGTPECAKCLKKNIKCSGVGKQYRFVDGVAGRRTTKARPVSTVSTAPRTSEHVIAKCSEPAIAGIPSANKPQDAYQWDTRFLTDSDERLLGSESNSLSPRLATDSLHVACRDDTVALSNTWQLCALESLSPTTRMLFDHCRWSMLKV